MVSSCTRAQLAWDYSHALGHLAAALVAQAACTYWVGGCLQPGRWRVACTIPAVVANLLAPLLFCRHEDVITIILVAFNTSWLTNFKLLAWAIGRGPLAEQPYSLTQFAAVLLAPITPQGPAPTGGRAGKARLADSAGSPGTLFAVWLAKLVFLSSIAVSLQYDLPALLRAFCMSMGLYALLSAIMDGPGALATGAIGIKVSPHFDKPWLASSFASVWSKHWDLAAGNSLRALVYEPICEGRVVKKATAVPPPRASPQRELLAGAATFFTSGVVHEYFFWCITGHTSGGVWLSFFLAQIPAIGLERIVLHWLKRRGLLLPTPLRIAYTIGGELVLSGFLFWRPTDQAGITGDVVNHVMHSMAAAGQALRRFV